jgi:hypothetical protein
MNDGILRIAGRKNVQAGLIASASSRPDMLASMGTGQLPLSRFDAVLAAILFVVHWACCSACYIVIVWQLPQRRKRPKEPTRPKRMFRT